jgi:hypothetical protein
MDTQIEKIKEEFEEKFTETDEDGQHIYEPSDIRSILQWFESKLQEVKAEAERKLEEAIPVCVEAGWTMAGEGWNGEYGVAFDRNSDPEQEVIGHLKAKYLLPEVKP